MTIAEILLQDFDHEMAGTRTTLERIPTDKPDFKCHDKSMPMGRLAVHVASLPRFGTSILTTSRGVMTGRAAVKAGVGGEVLCNIW